MARFSIRLPTTIDWDPQDPSLPRHPRPPRHPSRPCPIGHLPGIGQIKRSFARWGGSRLVCPAFPCPRFPCPRFPCPIGACLRCRHSGPPTKAILQTTPGRPPCWPQSPRVPRKSKRERSAHGPGPDKCSPSTETGRTSKVIPIEWPEHPLSKNLPCVNDSSRHPSQNRTATLKPSPNGWPSHGPAIDDDWVHKSCRPLSDRPYSDRPHSDRPDKRRPKNSLLIIPVCKPPAPLVRIH
jgi:hypothetical protein